MSKLSPVCDFFVLGTGSSGRQMRSVAGDVEEYASEQKLSHLSTSGTGEQWTAIDLVDIVVHLFTPESRDFYDLDNLWADAVDVPWKRT
jgi:ribosome-associated protein